MRLTRALFTLLVSLSAVTAHTQQTMVLDGREAVEFAPSGPSAIHTAASTGDGTMMIGMAGTVSIAT